MMSDPAQMQQAMAMSQNMFGGTLGGTQATPTMPAPAANPMAAMMQQMMGAGGGQMPSGQSTPAANPMNAMMQQMMSNPAVMQQSMAMAQQMFSGGAVAPNQNQAGFPSPAPTFTPAGALPATTTPAGNPMADAMLSAQRAQFASQLSQLVAMGFTNEALCLRALAQHNGRIDAAIDTLLSSGESCA